MSKKFYTSLQRQGRDREHFISLLEGRYVGEPKLLPIYKALYDRRLTVSDQTHLLIPKKIHQIWLGGTLPCYQSSFIETWASLTGWEYKLWTDEDVEGILNYNRDLFQLGKNYGEKSDILRLEILNQEGGLYVDIDTECLNCAFFHHLHSTLTFYSGFEPLEHKWLGISNALMGSAPGHPLLKKMIFDLRSYFFRYEKMGTVVKTGPKYVTTVIEEFIQNDLIQNICFFPPSYFCPASGNDIKKGHIQLFEESAALHHWNGSWLWNSIP